MMRPRRWAPCSPRPAQRLCPGDAVAKCSGGGALRRANHPSGEPADQRRRHL
ncbi:hypothetical protein LNQ52_22790 [Klebsiella pneumoniae subsp. pneumoniae]|nr:hypothetical protein [Klebsiella pneumoniae subsp. pneumoniae]